MLNTNPYERIKWENEPSVNTPLSADNLNKMDFQIYRHYVELNNLDKGKLDKIDAMLLVQDVQYEKDKGLIISKYNGSKKTIGIKLPFEFGIDADGNYGYYKEGESKLTPFKSGSAYDYSVCTTHTTTDTRNYGDNYLSTEIHLAKGEYILVCTALQFRNNSVTSGFQDLIGDGELFNFDAPNGMEIIEKIEPNKFLIDVYYEDDFLIDFETIPAQIDGSALLMIKSYKQT